MLKVGCPISGFFQLVLEVLPKLTPNTINEGLGTPEILLEESLELWPRDKSGAFVAAFVLSPSKADGTTEEDGGKEGTIYLCGARDFEIILTLQTKIVAIHVGFFGVGFRGLSLEWALT